MNEEIFENQLDEKIKYLISKMEKKLAEKDAEINNLQNEVAILIAQLANRNKKIFSSTSEKADPNQLSLFNEAEKAQIVEILTELNGLSNLDPNAIYKMEIDDLKN